MDDITETIAAYATDFDFGDLHAATVATAIDHIVDGISCAIAGFAEQPALIARSLAAETAGLKGGASVFGAQAPCAPDHAAFANGVMMRCLDYNDTLNSLTGGHPSDMIPAILTAAEISGADGRAFIGGVYVAYEVFGALAAVIPLRTLGIDQGVFIAIAGAAGMGYAMGLDRKTTANAISLGVTTTVPLRASRAGALSAWKGCATPHSVMNAVFVTRLAMRGMEAPPNPFSGEQGLFERIGGPFDLDPLGAPEDGRQVIARTAIKFLPVEWCAQAPVELFLGLGKHLNWHDIEAVEVHGYEFLVNEIGGGRNDAAEKWDPKTRETADHSLPYIFARTLVEGPLTLASFELDAVRDPALRPLMAKIKVIVDDAIEALMPATTKVRVVAKAAGGVTQSVEVVNPLGHPDNPMQDSHIDEKFHAMGDGVLGTERCSTALAAWRGVRDADDLRSLMALLEL